MQDNPFASFFLKMKSYQLEDVAVLMALLPYQMAAFEEQSDLGLMSPVIETRIWTLDLPPDRLSASVKRLVESGELEMVNYSNRRGYRITRFAELIGEITQYGGRRYARMKVRKHREQRDTSLT